VFCAFTVGGIAIALTGTSPSDEVIGAASAALGALMTVLALRVGPCPQLIVAERAFPTPYEEFRREIEACAGRSYPI
jgi:hypothetical protein